MTSLEIALNQDPEYRKWKAKDSELRSEIKKIERMFYLLDRRDERELIPREDEELHTINGQLTKAGYGFKI